MGWDGGSAIYHRIRRHVAITASDPLALAYHLPVDCVKKVRDLEADGFTIQLPD